MTTAAKKIEVGSVAQSPEAIAAETAALIGLLVSGGKLGLDAATKAAEYMRSKDINLASQVLRSYADSDDHVLLVRLTSYSPHGICIRKVTVSNPDGASATVEALQPSTRRSMGLDQQDDPAPAPVVGLPFVLAPTASQDLRIRIPRSVMAGLRGGGMRGAKLRVVFDLYSRSDPKDHDIEVLLSDDDPPVLHYTE
jgi:hypothetical protein